MSCMLLHLEGIVLVSFWYRALDTSWCTSGVRELVGYVIPVGVSWFSCVIGRLCTCIVVASVW